MWCRSERVWKCLAVSVCPRDPHSTADSSCWRLALTTNSGSRPTTKCLAVDSQKQELQRGNRFPESKPPGSSEVKNLPAVQEVWLLDQEDPLEEGMATHSSILAWRIPWTGDWRATVHGVAKSQTQLSDKQFHFLQLHFSGRYVRLLAFICKLWFVCLCQASGWLVSSGFSYSLPSLSSRFSLACLLRLCQYNSYNKSAFLKTYNDSAFLGLD